MAIPNRQIGWSQESNLLWEISRELDQLTKVVSASAAPVAPYKVYTAIYTQNGGANPTPVLINALENTITPGDTPVISYFNLGIYTITFSSAVLTIGKVFATCNTWGDDGVSPISSSAWPQGDAQSVVIGNQFGYDAANYISVEIRVYN
jgi:hypothetical protein